MNRERATQDGYITHRSIHESNHASTFMIIRIKHNPTILALELWTWKELHKMVTSDTDQYTKTIMHQPSWSYASSNNRTILALELWTWKELYKMVTSHTDQYTKTIMHQPSWSYASSITQLSWHWIRIQKLTELNILYCTHSQVPLVITPRTVQCYWKPKHPFIVQNCNLALCDVCTPVTMYKNQSLHHKITPWMYLCVTFNANTTTAVEHRSSHSFIAVV